MYEREYNDWKNFGIRLKNARQSIGMTIEKLAEKSNRSENFIFRIESGKKSCSIHTLYMFCKAMNISSDCLLFGKDEMPEDYTDKEIIENIIEKCNEKQLHIIKDMLATLYFNFEDFENSNSNFN